jgi:hypothetical protein
MTEHEQFDRDRQVASWLRQMHAHEERQAAERAAVVAAVSKPVVRTAVDQAEHDKRLAELHASLAELATREHRADLGGVEPIDLDNLS